MRFMRGVLWVLLAAAVFGFCLSFAIEGAYSSRAVLVQPIEPSPGAPVPDRYVGQPEKVLVEDRGAFMPGDTDEGAKRLNLGYLRAHRETPLQLTTIEFFAYMARCGAIAAAVMAGCGLAWITTQNKVPFALPPEIR